MQKLEINKRAEVNEIENKKQQIKSMKLKYGVGEINKMDKCWAWERKRKKEGRKEERKEGKKRGKKVNFERS